MTNPVWGCPWHGRVEGGELELPTGAKMAWPQPGGEDLTAYTRYDTPGYTHLVRMPDVAEIQQTPAEQAADATAGRQWLREAVIAGVGTESQLHGRPIRGWIYAAPDGSRWRVPLLADVTVSTSSGLTLGARLYRFGAFGMPSQSFSLGSLALSFAQLGIASWSSSQPRRFARVESIAPAGNKAVFAVYREDDPVFPLVFLLLELSGTPGVNLSAQLTVLRAPEQVSGQLTVSNGAPGELWDITINTEEEVDPETGRTTTTYAGVTWTPGTGSHAVYVGTNEYRRIGRIISVWLDDSGNPVDVALDVERRSVLDIPRAEITVSGRSVQNFGGVYSEWPTLVAARTSTRSDHDIIRLRAGEHAVEISVQWSGTWTETDSQPGDGTRTYTITRQFQNAFMSHTHQWADEATQEFSPEEYPHPFSIPGALYERVFESDSLDRGLLSYGQSGEIIAGVQQAVHTRLRRWSNNLIGFIAGTAAPGGAPQQFHWFAALSPSGPAGDAGTAVPSQDISYFIYERPYGSYNPITQEAVIASETPVSYT